MSYNPFFSFLTLEGRINHNTYYYILTLHFEFNHLTRDGFI